MAHRFGTTTLMATAAALMLTGSSPESVGSGAGGPDRASSRPAPRLDVLVEGVARPQYALGGTRYIEALKGREYQIRLTNPYAVRVAVALAVDGLNTIDARHTTAAAARKWVLDPHETITLGGWQVSQSHARRFVFTTEARSYGQALGQTENFGVITAVFFRERLVRPHVIPIETPAPAMPGRAGAAPPAEARPEADRRREAETSTASASKSEPVSDEYAATGIGRRTTHAVQTVAIDLEDTPAASVSLRYEYREQLVRLGIRLEGRDEDALARRERARGFADGFCPEPKR